jgi:hypothetical protein
MHAAVPATSTPLCKTPSQTTALMPPAIVYDGHKRAGDEHDWLQIGQPVSGFTAIPNRTPPFPCGPTA